MTRTNRANSHGSEPKYFAKSGHADQDPNKTKKNGAGKLNWGREGEELEDLINAGECNVFHRRRSSNAARNIAWEVNPKYDSDVEESAVSS